jgi:hypothetical protein
MSEPRRWRDGAEAPDEVRELLAAGAKPRGMSPTERAAAARQAGRIAAVPVGLFAWWGAAKALAAGLAVAGVVAGAVVVAERVRAPAATPAALTTARARVAARVAPRRPVEPPSRIEPAPVGPVAAAPVQVGVTPRGLVVARPSRPTPVAVAAPSAPPPPAAEPVAVASPAAPSVPAPAPARDESLAAEAALLVRAHRGLEVDPARSLALVDAHAGFAHPALAEERELIAVLALQRLGRREEARARGDALVARWPSGAAAQRVRGLRSTAP